MEAFASSLISGHACVGIGFANEELFSSLILASCQLHRVTSGWTEAILKTTFKNFQCKEGYQIIIKEFRKEFHQYLMCVSATCASHACSRHHMCRLGHKMAGAHSFIFTALKSYFITKQTTKNVLWVCFDSTSITRVTMLLCLVFPLKCSPAR